MGTIPLSRSNRQRLKKSSKLRDAVRPHFSLIVELRNQKKSLAEICHHLKVERLFISPVRLAKVLDELGGNLKAKAMLSHKLRRERVKQKRLELQIEKSKQPEPDLTIIDAPAHESLLNRKSKKRRSRRLGDANAYLGLIRELWCDGRSFQNIARHLKRAFAVSITQRKIAEALFTTKVEQTVPIPGVGLTIEQVPVEKPNNKRHWKTNRIIQNVDTVQTWRRNGLTFEMIAFQMKDKYELEVSVRALKSVLRQAERQQALNEARAGLGNAK